MMISYLFLWSTPRDLVFSFVLRLSPHFLGLNPGRDPVLLQVGMGQGTAPLSRLLVHHQPGGPVPLSDYVTTPQSPVHPLRPSHSVPPSTDHHLVFHPRVVGDLTIRRNNPLVVIGVSNYDFTLITHPPRRMGVIPGGDYSVGEGGTLGNPQVCFEVVTGVLSRHPLPLPGVLLGPCKLYTPRGTLVL